MSARKLPHHPDCKKMPKILPSQIVSAIDSMFGPSRNEIYSDAITWAYRAEVHALLGMLDEVPGELIDLSSTDYLEFRAAEQCFRPRSRFGMAATAGRPAMSAAKIR